MTESTDNENLLNFAEEGFPEEMLNRSKSRKMTQNLKKSNVSMNSAKSSLQKHREIKVIELIDKQIQAVRKQRQFRIYSNNEEVDFCTFSQIETVKLGGQTIEEAK